MGSGYTVFYHDVGGSSGPYRSVDEAIGVGRRSRRLFRVENEDGIIVYCSSVVVLCDNAGNGTSGRVVPPDDRHLE